MLPLKRPLQKGYVAFKKALKKDMIPLKRPLQKGYVFGRPPEESPWKRTGIP